MREPRRSFRGMDFVSLCRRLSAAGNANMTPYIPLLCLIACSFALPVGAQSRVATPPHTECHNVGATVTCKNVTPVPAADALRIFTTSTEPFTTSTAPDVREEPPPFVPEGSTYIGRIHGDVFSDRWPFESAGIYARLFGERRVRYPRAVSPGLYGGVRLAFDPLTGRWYR